VLVGLIVLAVGWQTKGKLIQVCSFFGLLIFSIFQCLDVVGCAAGGASGL